VFLVLACQCLSIALRADPGGRGLCRRRDADLHAVVGLLGLVGLRRPRVDSPWAGARRGGRGGRRRGVPVPPAERVPQPRGGDHTRALRLLALRGQAARAHPRQAHDPENMGKSYVSFFLGPRCCGNR